MKAPGFDAMSLDSGLDRLQSEVKKLSRQKLAALFGAIGSTMLPIYIRFVENNRWGDATVLRGALDAVMGYATGKPDLRDIGENLLASIAAVIPSEERFEVPESTFAMDAAICVDAAIRAADPTQDVDPAWVEYALDPLITTLCKQQTGYLDLGSSPQAKFWRSQALKSPALREGFEGFSEMIILLSNMDFPVTQIGLDSLQQLAVRLVPKLPGETANELSLGE